MNYGTPVDDRGVATDLEHGKAAAVTEDQILRALSIPRRGRTYSLALPRFDGMPLFSSHPPFQVSMYRTPRGLRAEGQQPWGPQNDVNLGYMAEVVSGTSHSGAHVDALAHMTIGEDDHWFGGSTAREFLGDRGPTRGDAAKLPNFVARGLLLDVPRFRSLQSLPAHSPVGADELREVARAQGVHVTKGDVVLIRTGYLRHWPDQQEMARHGGAGPDLGAARWLLDQGVIAVGSDTETLEVQPAPESAGPRNPQPVHTLLLIQNAIYLFESIYLEGLSKDDAYEFLFLALPIKIQGATGSMLDPLAIV